MLILRSIVSALAAAEALLLSIIAPSIVPAFALCLFYETLATRLDVIAVPDVASTIVFLLRFGSNHISPLLNGAEDTAATTVDFDITDIFRVINSSARTGRAVITDTLELASLERIISPFKDACGVSRSIAYDSSGIDCVSWPSWCHDWIYEGISPEILADPFCEATCPGITVVAAALGVEAQSLVDETVDAAKPLLLEDEVEGAPQDTDCNYNHPPTNGTATSSQSTYAPETFEPLPEFVKIAKKIFAELPDRVVEEYTRNFEAWSEDATWLIAELIVFGCYVILLLNLLRPIEPFSHMMPRQINYPAQGATRMI